MYEFHDIKRKYDAKFSFTDTNSLVYEIKTEDVYEYFFKIKVYLIFVTMHRIQIVFILSIKKLMLIER